MFKLSVDAFTESDLTFLSCSKDTRYSHGKDVQGFDWWSDHFEIVLQDGDGARESLVATAAEERHAGIEQDGGDERGVGNPTQAFNTALRAT